MCSCQNNVTGEKRLETFSVKNATQCQATILGQDQKSVCVCVFVFVFMFVLVCGVIYVCDT